MIEGPAQLPLDAHMDGRRGWRSGLWKRQTRSPRAGVCGCGRRSSARGLVAKAIVAEAEAAGADLIVVRSPPRPRQGTLRQDGRLRSSKHARCRVLVMRPVTQLPPRPLSHARSGSSSAGRGDRELDETLLPKSSRCRSSRPTRSPRSPTRPRRRWPSSSPSGRFRAPVFPISIAISVLLAIVMRLVRQGVPTPRAAAPTSSPRRTSARCRRSSPAPPLVDYVLTVRSRSPPGSSRSPRPRPSLAPHQLALSLACIVLLTSATCAASASRACSSLSRPTASSCCSSLTLGSASAKCTVGSCPGDRAASARRRSRRARRLRPAEGVLVRLRALTGVESISNGVTAFRRPQAQNAARTST